MWPRSDGDTRSRPAIRCERQRRKCWRASRFALSRCMGHLALLGREAAEKALRIVAPVGEKAQHVASVLSRGRSRRPRWRALPDRGARLYSTIVRLEIHSDGHLSGRASMNGAMNALCASLRHRFLSLIHPRKRSPKAIQANRFDSSSRGAGRQSGRGESPDDAQARRSSGSADRGRYPCRRERSNSRGSGSQSRAGWPHTIDGDIVNGVCRVMSRKTSMKSPGIFLRSAWWGMVTSVLLVTPRFPQPGQRTGGACEITTRRAQARLFRARQLLSFASRAIQDQDRHPNPPCSL